MGSDSSNEALRSQRERASSPTAAFGPLFYKRAAEGMLWNQRRSRHRYTTGYASVRDAKRRGGCRWWSASGSAEGALVAGRPPKIASGGRLIRGRWGCRRREGGLEGGGLYGPIAK